MACEDVFTVYTNTGTPIWATWHLYYLSVWFSMFLTNPLFPEYSSLDQLHHGKTVGTAEQDF